MSDDQSHGSADSAKNLIDLGDDYLRLIGASRSIDEVAD